MFNNNNDGHNNNGHNQIIVVIVMMLYQVYMIYLSLKDLMSNIYYLMNQTTKQRSSIVMVSIIMSSFFKLNNKITNITRNIRNARILIVVHHVILSLPKATIATTTTFNIIN